MVGTTATSIDATQRKLIVGIVIATLMAWAIVIADLARGGRPADAVRLGDHHPAPGLFDRANLAFQRERIDRAAEIGGGGRHVDADRHARPNGLTDDRLRFVGDSLKC